MAGATEEYRDRLFCFIFGSEDHKDWTLDLYNAVNNTSYTDPSQITIATLTQVLYMGMQDDVGGFPIHSRKTDGTRLTLK